MFEEMTRLLESQCRFRRVIEDWWNVGWVRRVALFLVVVASGRLVEGRWCGPRLLPFQVFIAMAAIWSRFGRNPRKRVVGLLSSPGCMLLSIWPLIDCWARCIAEV